MNSSMPTPEPLKAPVLLPDCPLCTEEGGALIWRDERLRVIRVDELGFPAFYRVVWNSHIAEFSELSGFERMHCMEVVTVVERILLQHLAPTKINIASLGNQVPHLHWHVVARFDWDSHFPSPLWASAQRERNLPQEAAVLERLPELEAVLRLQLPRC